ncbi:hypothetical protein AAHE18_09G159600 [Arachis hypogaea]
MKNKLIRRIKKLFSCSVCKPSSPNHEASVDVREEYANAFRTESYIDSSTSARLPSYRLFAEHLLDPDQPTPLINRVLHIDRVRVKYQSLKTILQCVATNQDHNTTTLSLIMAQLTEFSNSLNPFSQSSPSSCLVRAAQCQYSELSKRLESSRDKVRANLQMMARLKGGSACLLVAITASLVVIIITHGLVLLVATPSLIGTMDLVKVASESKLKKVMAQLNAAAKGTYIVNKDLETTGRLVARLNDELEYMRTTVKFRIERKEDKIQADGEVEHLYLCFMTINRARDLVLKKIIHSA